MNGLSSGGGIGNGVSLPYFDQDMPARAKRLFRNTFRRYQDSGGGEEIAIRAAWEAVNREYVKLNNRWIPKVAAKVIVQHDIDDSSEDESSLNQSKTHALASGRAKVAFKRRGGGDGGETPVHHRSVMTSDESSSDGYSDEDSDDQNSKFTSLNRKYSYNRFNGRNFFKTPNKRH
ncbi:unknown [Spodoptera litura nucleopolyhedrovirus]|uniref:Uncharacterized protein n=1 Tax=Spodoptera litura multicapsid nucleopolyhedrovirus TaxID=46242 RepID=Q91BH3_NPVST|nr:hypothetical protein [Spodoptera litura nucleopolyhedrovirus]AAL01737.1 unknown [Spodoptera litura nucleopolyhedrovirus]